MNDFIKQLCLQCGLCCNGVLFADVRPERGDDSPLFKQYGPRVAQPCPAFNSSNCKCAIYAKRPARCRKFECNQLLAVRAGKKSVDAALKKIGDTKRLAAEVERLLVELGFNDKRLPYSKRFQNCRRAADTGKIASEKFAQLADLQLAVHKLNGSLAQDFYA